MVGLQFGVVCSEDSLLHGSRRQQYDHQLGLNLCSRTSWGFADVHSHSCTPTSPTSYPMIPSFEATKRMEHLAASGDFQNFRATRRYSTTDKYGAARELSDYRDQFRNLSDEYGAISGTDGSSLEPSEHKFFIVIGTEVLRNHRNRCSS